VATRQTDPEAPSGSGTPYGESGFLSSASSWDLPVGSRIDPASVAGYYIDFRSKVRDPSWPPPWLAPPERQVHVETAQWGLGCFEAHLHTGDARWLEAAAGAAHYLASLLTERGELVHGVPMEHTYPLDPPWLSGMAQGEAASLMVRVHLAKGDRSLAEKARAALEPLRRPSTEGGAMAMLDGTPFPEEYPTQPPSFVLNGGIFAIWGYRDVGLGLGDAEADRWFEEAAAGLIANLHRWDAGYWSRYDLFPHPVANIASAAYHTLHIDQLEALSLLRPDPELTATIERWRGYQASRRCRARAFAAKAVFRLLVPRNRFLASRLPTSARSRRAS
jgi:heparosan-N-sulfate-glucuronate 5-epimerase